MANSSERLWSRLAMDSRKLRCAAGSATNTPWPCRTIRRPSACSERTASRTEGRLTPRAAASSRSEGRRSPGDRRLFSKNRMISSRMRFVSVPCPSCCQAAAASACPPTTTARIPSGRPSPSAPMLPARGQTSDAFGTRPVAERCTLTAALCSSACYLTKWAEARPLATYRSAPLIPNRRLRHGSH